MSDENNDDTTAPEEAHQEGDTNAAPWQKGGPSPNPKGRPRQPKTVREVKELAKQYTHQMVEVLSRVALNPKSPPAARVAAAEGLLSRAWGKPSGDFEGLGEQLLIQIVKFNNPQVAGDDAKLTEGAVAGDEEDAK